LSRIHDALRRGRRSAEPAETPRAWAHADAVLTTLGYKAESTRRPMVRVLASLIAATLLLIGFVWWSGWTPLAPHSAAPVPQRAAAATSRPTVTPQSNPAARPAPPSIPAAPTLTPTPAPTPTLTHTPTLVRPHPQPAALSHTAPRTRSAAGDDFQLALYYQRSGEFDQSLVHYKAVLQRDELNVEAHNNLGLLYRDKGLAEEAVREFQRALFIAPRYVRAHNNLGVTLLDLGRRDAAAAEFRAVLALEPRNVDALVNLALALKAGGQLSDARGSLLHALAIDPHNAAAHYNLAVQYEETGDAARAVEHYRAFIQNAGPEYASRIPDVRVRASALEARIK
jgi:Tfp pilus assembly protein PilF